MAVATSGLLVGSWSASKRGRLRPVLLFKPFEKMAKFILLRLQIFPI